MYENGTVPSVEIQVNLDCLDEAELFQLQFVFSHLSEYCRLKSSAMKYRHGGRIQEARILEDKCQKFYGYLPEEFRW